MDSPLADTARLGTTLLSLLPVMVLRHPVSGRLLLATVRDRLQRFAQGDWRILLEEALHDALARKPPAPPPPSPPAAPAAADDAARLRRQGREAGALARCGQYSRAAARLASDDTLAPLTAATIARLRALHPDEAGTEDIAWSPAYRAELAAITVRSPIVISAAKVTQFFASANPRSSGGPSGLTASHLQEAVLSSAALAS